MPRPKSTLLTDRETEIMSVLWDRGSASAEEIRGRISGDSHDSTVRTLLRVLISKGLVHTVCDSRPAVYRPAVKRLSMQKRATKDLLKRFFGGSVEELVLHLLDDERLSPAQLKALELKFRPRSAKEK